MVLRDDVAGRVPGVALLALGWRTVRLAPSWSTGARRIVARTCGTVLMLVGVLWAIGVEARAVAGELLPDGVRELVAATAVLLASVWVWRTSPAVR